MSVRTWTATDGHRQGFEVLSRSQTVIQGKQHGKGSAELVLSAPAEDLAQAVQGFMLMLQGLPLEAIAVATSEAFDLRSELESTDLLTVTQAAEVLGVTRAAVQKRIDSEALPAKRLGSVWAIPAAALSPRR